MLADENTEPSCAFFLFLTASQAPTAASCPTPCAKPTALPTGECGSVPGLRDGADGANAWPSSQPRVAGDALCDSTAVGGDGTLLPPP